MISFNVLADGAVIDKIYHPFVDALEQEIEYRSIFQDSQSGFIRQHNYTKFLLGHR